MSTRQVCGCGPSQHVLLLIPENSVPHCWVTHTHTHTSLEHINPFARWDNFLEICVPTTHPVSSCEKRSHSTPLNFVIQLGKEKAEELEMSIFGWMSYYNFKSNLFENNILLQSALSNNRSKKHFKVVFQGLPFALTVMMSPERKAGQVFTMIDGVEERHTSSS